MKTIQVKAVKRENYGKKAAKAVRREGQIPAVLYGGGETVSFSVDPREIKPLIYTPNSYIVDLEIDGKTEKAVLRDVQFHPIREEILHMDFYPEHDSVLHLLTEVRKEVCVIPVIPENRFPMSFSHIFAGGYAAGYYSYKWAEVLSADAFSLFQEKGIFSPEIGKKWLDEVISRGGSRPAMESFVAFRGRKPTVDALLRHSGMSEDK